MLPDEAYLTVKLTYYDERTPSDYQPPGFEETDVQFNCDKVLTPFDTTKVSTAHHGIQVKIRQKDFCEDDLQSVCGSARRSQVPDTEGMISINCPCETTTDSDAIMLTCQACHTKQHGACFLVFSEDKIPEKHLCHMCALEMDVPERCVERRLVRMIKKKVSPAATCQYRRVLAFCTVKDFVSMADIKELVNLEAQDVLAIVEKLVTDKTLIHDQEDGQSLEMASLTVNKGVLRRTIVPKYLGKENVMILMPDQEVSNENVQAELNGIVQDTENLSVTEVSFNIF